MSIQLGNAVRDARLNAIETTIGSTPPPHLKIFGGTAPGNCGIADTGSLLVNMTLPADFLANAASGVKIIANAPWSGTASGSGTATHFRIYDAATAAICLLQGTCGIGTGDLWLDNTSITSGQAVSVTGFTLTDGNS